MSTCLRDLEFVYFSHSPSNLLDDSAKRFRAISRDRPTLRDSQGAANWADHFSTPRSSAMFPVAHTSKCDSLQKRADCNNCPYRPRASVWKAPSHDFPRCSKEMRLLLVSVYVLHRGRLVCCVSKFSKYWRRIVTFAIMVGSCTSMSMCYSFTKLICSLWSKGFAAFHFVEVQYRGSFLQGRSSVTQKLSTQNGNKTSWHGGKASAPFEGKSCSMSGRSSAACTGKGQIIAGVFFPL